MLSAIEIKAFRRANVPYGALLQIDVSLVGRFKPSVPDEPFLGGVAYTGWIRDLAANRLYSAQRDDVIDTAPPLESLVGEFSLAALGEHAAVTATDHYATQPVYYHNSSNNRVIVSSDLRLVLAAPHLAVAINEEACVHFLSRALMVNENEPSDGMTFFKGVKKLPPNGVLAIDYVTGQPVVTIRDQTRFGSAGTDASTRDYVGAFRQTLDRCVQDRLAAGANALLLSGGIDSSTVLGACLASDYPPPCSIAMGFKDADLVMSQDDKLLEAMFSQRELPHKMLYADPFLRLPSDTDHSAWVDGPDTSANPLIKDAYAHLLQESGQSGMVMTGEGGDAVLGESMHEWIVDAIRANDGIRAAHRYISQNHGHRPCSPAYFREMLNAVCPPFAYWNWRRRSQGADRRSLPPYLGPALSSGGFDERDRRNSNNFAFVGHHAAYDMLFPRASYFDSLSGVCMHSHPFLDPRMIAFSFSVPPHAHHDYRNLDPRNAYATSKKLARAAYQDQLPSYIYGKTHKTSYALMARRIFHNSARALYRITEEPMLLHQKGLIDQPTFQRHLLAYIIATEDPNANLGVNYHFIRGVTDLETWLRRFSCTRAQFNERISILPLRSPL